MRGIKKSLCVLVILAFTFILVGCGGGKTVTNKGEQANKKVFLNVATSTTGGTFYAVGGKLADMISKNIPNTQATTQATAGGVENARLFKNKGAEMALMPGDTLFNAVNGVGEFKEGKIDIKQIAALYPTPLQIVALEKSGIKTITDLKGKRVSIGAPGSSTAVRAEIVLKAYGLTLKDIRVDSTTSGESSSQLLDNMVDAAFYASGAPMAAIMDTAAKEKIVLCSVSPDKMAKIQQDHPYLFPVVIKGGTYPGLSSDVTCVANMAVLACRPDLSEDLVYQITKMIFEQRDDFVTAHKAVAESFSLENAMSQEKLATFHPGALKYYKEKGLVK